MSKPLYVYVFRRCAKRAVRVIGNFHFYCLSVSRNRLEEVNGQLNTYQCPDIKRFPRTQRRRTHGHGKGVAQVVSVEPVVVNEPAGGQYTGCDDNPHGDLRAALGRANSFMTEWGFDGEKSVQAERHNRPDQEERVICFQNFVARNSTPAITSD